MNKNKGTALLVTVLLIGAIGAIAFGVFKIANSELFVGTKQEEGTEAFYAAQAGVEDALMRFKFSDSGRLEIPDGAREDTPEVLRVDIINGSLGNQDYNDKSKNPESDKYIYDLKAWYKTDKFEIMLEKDQSVILDVSDFVDRGNLLVRWAPQGPGVDVKNSKLWYRLYDPEGASRDPRDDLKRDFFTYLAYYNEGNNPAIRPGAPLENFPPLPPNTPNPFKTRGFKTIKFKAFGDDNSKIKLIVRSTNDDALIGGPNLYIESTGYYGDTARKLKVTVDRASKSVLDIFDYVIYSGNKPLP